MRWVLVGPSGHVVREVEADSLPEARFRLAPIPKDHFVQSRVTYAGPLPTPKAVKTVRQLLSRSTHAQRTKNAEKQARWRAKKLQQDAQWDAKRRWANRVITSRKLAEVSGVMVGLMVEGVDERTIAKRFGVSQQAVNNIRRYYAAPTPKEIRRRQVECLSRYYAAQGLPLYEIANRANASRKMVRNILNGGN